MQHQYHQIGTLRWTVRCCDRNHRAAAHPSPEMKASARSRRAVTSAFGDALRSETAHTIADRMRYGHPNPLSIGPTLLLLVGSRRSYQSIGLQWYIVVLLPYLRTCLLRSIARLRALRQRVEWGRIDIVDASRVKPLMNEEFRNRSSPSFVRSAIALLVAAFVAEDDFHGAFRSHHRDLRRRPGN